MTTINATAFLSCIIVAATGTRSVSAAKSFEVPPIAHGLALDNDRSDGIGIARHAQSAATRDGATTGCDTTDAAGTTRQRRAAGAEGR